MSKRVLLTTTSFQDTPGLHHDVLAKSGYEIVRGRGPFSEAQMLELVTKDGGFDGFLNGDDRITAKVIDAALPRLKVIAKYGIGLDSIDVAYATSKRIPVLFTPGVNETTVAEHAFGLMIAVAKNFWFHLRAVKAGQWKRKTGHELYGKTLGILGLGRIGKEVVKRAGAFGMTCIGHGNHWDEEFAKEYHLERLPTREDVLRQADIVSLHINLTPETRGFINKERIAMMKEGRDSHQHRPRRMRGGAGRGGRVQVGQAFRLRRRRGRSRADENTAHLSGNRQYHPDAACRQPDVRKRATAGAAGGE